MYFYSVYLSEFKRSFTWSFEEKIPLGSRVLVPFRQFQKIGLVVEGPTKIPEKIKSIKKIIKILEREMIPPNYFELLSFIAQETFFESESIFDLLVTSSFFSKINFFYREHFFSLEGDKLQAVLGDLEVFFKTQKIRGPQQKKAIEIIFQTPNQKIVAEKLKTEISNSTLKNLLEKKVLTESFGKIPSFAKSSKIIRTKNHPLTQTQKKVLAGIIASKKPNLLFGVTGSGKTEIYKALGEKVKKEGKKTLFLLPEIALTPQLMAEFKNVFGERMAVWHSKLTPREKNQEWARVVGGEVDILVGARSAIFVPMRDLGLIILDEEHEWTYKNEHSPRFLTHDLAEFLAKKNEATLVFGSATPRMESFYKVGQKKWNLFELKQRISQNSLPEIEIVDLKNEIKRKNYGPISKKMETEITEVLSQKKQAVIFLNKRGFSGSTMCKICGQNFFCPACDIEMKRHRKEKKQGVLEKFCCHFCGHIEDFPKNCPSCKTADFEFRGWGTQMVEKEIQQKFPKARIIRADRDTLKNRDDFEKMMHDFEQKKADILLGTQMIAKGLDFREVTFCGVILADVGLHLPDFRSEEKVFQLLTQVAGRVGRHDLLGKTLIQTYNPDEKIFEFIKSYDTEGFVAWQNEIRKEMSMPPFFMMAKFTFVDPKKEVSFASAKKFLEYAESIRDDLKTSKAIKTLQVHFAPAFFPKMNHQYYFHVFFQFLECDKNIIFKDLEIPEGVRVDINPSSML